MTPIRQLSLWMLLALLFGCAESEPLKIGFIAGTSGRVADLGVGGRNGVILATEQRNASDGIRGRKIELLMRDDRQDTELAKQHAQELIEQGVEAILGPMTSAMAKAITPITDANRVLVLGITVTTNELTGIDDYFFRTLAATRNHASKSADYQLQKGVDSFALALDTRNLAYTQSWGDDFSTQLDAGGGSVRLRVPFESSEQAPFQQLAKQLVDSGAKGIALICNSVDAALLAQNIRKLDQQVTIATSEWAGTERLIELGGRAVEGITVPQYLDRYSNETRFKAFREQYLARFGHEPGYPGLIAYNAANVLYTALEQQQTSETLKQALLRIRQFNGVQEPIEFDRFGDTQSRTYITQIQQAQFRVVQ